MVSYCFNFFKILKYAKEYEIEKGDKSSNTPRFGVINFTAFIFKEKKFNLKGEGDDRNEQYIPLLLYSAPIQEHTPS